MRIDTIQAEPGTKAFGFLKATETHGGFPVHLPLHIVAGAGEGPVLLVQAGHSGLEIEAATVLPHLVKDLDPAQIRGTLLVVPLMNTSGFEFEQAHSAWDDKDLNALGRGDPHGTVSEQLIAKYFGEVVARADALLDLHSGALWSYYCYAGVYATGAQAAARGLAESLGLPQVLLGQPNDDSMALEAARDGKSVVSVWLGGGPGLRDYRQEYAQQLRGVVLNAMRHLGMMDGDLESEYKRVAVVQCHTVLKVDGPRGLTFMDFSKRGLPVAAGEQLGLVRHPHTGLTLQTITAPRAGIVIDAGAVWPVLPEDATLAILGDLIEDLVEDLVEEVKRGE